MSAFQDAKTAHEILLQLRASIQMLTDAAERGQTITHGDLLFINKDCAVLGYAVAKTFHTISREGSDRRRMEANHA